MSKKCQVETLRGTVLSAKEISQCPPSNLIVWPTHSINGCELFKGVETTFQKLSPEGRVFV